MKTMFALIMLTAAVIPSATYAGDSEWATAGKILTGVVGLQAVQSLSNRSSYSNSNSSYNGSYSNRSSYSNGHHSDYGRYQQPAYNPRYAPPPQRYERGCEPSRTTTTIIRYEPAPVQVVRCPPPQQTIIVAPVRECQPVVVPYCDNPVVLEINSTRRVYQPRIHGHTAYLQIFDQGQWFTLREYPSVY